MTSEPMGGVASSSAAGEAGDEGSQRTLFGTFTGVFLPTILTIFGVIMFVRIGSLVGNAGLAGAWAVMLLAMGITAATGLSLSSIATNTKIGPGGPYAIMARSLGFDVGGAIGVPLYLTRPLGVAMYVIGFREGWLWVFPDHPPIVIDILVFLLLTSISYISADLAFRVQYLIMAIILGSLVSIFMSPVTFDPVVTEINWLGDYRGFPDDGFTGTDYWGVFAVFFPATTGILAGANMSGDLQDPRRAIPRGTLWALGISTVVYLLLAVWCARAGTVEELVSNYTIAIDKAAWSPIVLAGLLGATASSALAGLVGGPRILMAMGEHRIIPFSDAMARTGPDGNPRGAVLVTAALTLVCIMARDLNTIAPLVTMFFLITYAMLNVVVLMESSLGLVSFRPTLRVPRIVPLFGLIGCTFSMFIVNPTFGLLSVGLVIAFYIWIHRRGTEEDAEDVRSSVFVSMAQWAASRVNEDERSNKRAWKPDMLVPIQDPEEVRGGYDLLLDLTLPDGSLTFLGLSPREQSDPALRTRLVELSEYFRDEGVQSSAAVLHTDDAVSGVAAGLEALQAAFFRPNLLLLTLHSDGESAPDVTMLDGSAFRVPVGLFLVGMHSRAGFGRRKRVNLWLRPAPNTWDPIAAFSSGNLNLNLLTGYRLLRRWDAELTLYTVIQDESEREDAEAFQSRIHDLARFPASVHNEILLGSFEDCLDRAPTADVNLIGMPHQPDIDWLLHIIIVARSTCIFVRDSGRESALV